MMRRCYYSLPAILIAGAVLSACSSTPQPTATRHPRANVVLSSAISVDGTKHTVTLPIHRATAGAKTVWYVITDASDVVEARRLGVAFAPLLGNVGAAATQHVSKRGGQYIFEGAPDFSKTRVYRASKSGFPPASAAPGSIGDSAYSPFVRVDGIRGVLNAPIVAVGERNFDVTRHTNTEDRVVAIDTAAKNATLVLARGFVNGKAVNYISTEASDPVAAAVERATYAPKLKRAAAAAIPIGVVVNGPMNPGGGQGLAYLALRTPLAQDATAANAASIGSPFNVLSNAPNPSNVYVRSGYSPLWSVSVLPHGKPSRITDFSAFSALGPKPAGFVVNCPVIAFE